MQAIILAAGNGVRMRPLTYKVPKPMAKVGKKSLVEHNIEKLPDEVDEIIFVIGYLAEQIMDYFGNEFLGKKITYIKQEEMLGTAHAVSLCKDNIKGRFIVMMGDDMYSKDDINECLKYERAMLVKKVYGKFAGGNIIFDENGCLQNIIEGIHEKKESFANTNFFVLTPEYFNYEMVLKAKDSKEYGLPQTVVTMSSDYLIKIVEATSWIKIDNMDDLKEFEKELRKNKK